MGLVDTKHKRKSMTITVLLHILILLLLFFFGMTYLDPPPENGIAVNFGTSDEGKGIRQPVEAIQTAPKKTITASISESPKDLQEEVVTQNNEEAPVIKKEEANKIPSESLTKQKKETPKKIEPQPDKATTDALSNLINAQKQDGIEQQGEGNNEKTGDKGDTNGDPNASSYYGTGKGLDGDGNYLLGGRKALNKEKYIQDCNEAGRVVVSIEVDRMGKVISAVPGVRGTTNNSKCLLEPARRAALETRFNADENAPSKQIGKIIYNFTLSR